MNKNANIGDSLLYNKLNVLLEFIIWVTNYIEKFYPENI
jgi:hypothetical protein